MYNLLLIVSLLVNCLGKTVRIIVVVAVRPLDSYLAVLDFLLSIVVQPSHAFCSVLFPSWFDLRAASPDSVARTDLFGTNPVAYCSSDGCYLRPRWISMTMMKKYRARKAIVNCPWHNLLVAVPYLHRSNAFWVLDIFEWRPTRLLQLTSLVLANNGNCHGGQTNRPTLSSFLGGGKPLTPS